MKHIMPQFWAIVLLLLYAACQQTTAPEPLADTSVQRHSTADTAVFYNLLQTALQQRDPNLLLPLLADTVVCNTDDKDYPGNNQKYLRDAVIRHYFKDPQSDAWNRFELVLRMPGLLVASPKVFSRKAAYVVPHIPPAPEDENQEYAYVFADAVNIRAEPNTNAPVLRKISRSFVAVDTDLLCYGDVDEDWLPVVINKKRAWVSISLTNWDVRQGCLIVGRDTKGQLRIIELNYGQSLPGTWFLPGCC